MAEIADLRRTLESDGVIQPELISFPFLKAIRPNLTYLRRLVGGGSIMPATGREQFLIVTIPDLELRALATCLEQQAGDTVLANALRNQRAGGVKQEIVRRISGLGADELIEHLVRQSQEYRLWDAVASPAMKYLPRGVRHLVGC